MKEVIFDAHTHIHFPAYNKDRDEVIKRAQNAGVKMIAVGTNMTTSKSAIAIAEKYPEDIWATVGFHPTEIGHWKLPSDRRASPKGGEFENLKILAQHPKVVAIGECGLDYFRNSNPPKNEQREIFLKQVELAQQLKKPLMIHCRPSKNTDDAYEDLLEEFLKINFQLPIIIHFFNGSLAITKKLFDAGFYFTFGGVITFSRDYDEVIKFLPIEKIMLETDAPYVAPAPYRGQRNEPSYVLEVAKRMAEIKNLALEDVIQKTTNNVYERLDVTRCF
ncbi:MAG: TatD family hydrolase [Patescibacteria group bacterium]